MQRMNKQTKKTFLSWNRKEEHNAPMLQCTNGKLFSSSKALISEGRRPCGQEGKRKEEWRILGRWASELGHICFQSVLMPHSFLPESILERASELAKLHPLDADHWCLSRAGGWVEIGLQGEVVWTLEK